ncbi:MAG: hypothetical protein GX621_03435, partial [Pirellulaceae bacterium]|nr:hypothetical protein [Pirellulaceae bacterium]
MSCNQLIFFRNEFYTRRGNYWRPIGTETLKAVLTAYLQHRDDIDQITDRLVRDVMLNLKALTVVATDEDMPFYITDFGPPAIVARRNLLVLRNGMIDLDTIVAGDEPELLPYDPRWFSTIALPYDFDPGARCPRFERFLRHVLEMDCETGSPTRQGDQRYHLLQEFFGYCLLSDGRFHKFLILVGVGSNGKSVVLHL